MDLRYCIIRSFLLVHCVGVVLSASYYQREYSGYLFTIPGFNDAERRSQTSAQTWCNANGSKLLAITNQSIQNAAVAFINGAIQQKEMTGNNIITDGMRTSEQWIWINETTMTDLSIGGQYSPNKSYAYIYVPSPSSVGLALYAETPNNRKYFICEGQVFCGYGYQYQKQCFQSFRDDQVSWYEARNLCLQRGGDLATFEFITTDNDLNMLNGSWLTPSRDYWIGLQREWWTWRSINSDVTYSQWSDGHPIYYNVNQQCLCLLPYDWKWSECDCSQASQFVCISSPVVTSTSQSTVPSTFTSTASPSSTSFDSISHLPSAIASDDRSHLGVGLGVGLGIGIPLLLIIIALIIVVMQQKRQLRNYESNASSSNKVEMTSTPAYESLQNGTTVNSPTYQELNVTN